MRNTFTTHRHVISIVLLTIFAFFFQHRITETWLTDESRHLMDGVFIADFLLEMPVFDIMGFVEEYFVRFPALGFTWYLPFFAFVEALFFLTLGVSMFSAKLTMLAFTIVAAICLFFIFRKLFSASVALVGVILLLSHPTFLLWSRSIMLEVPSLAMMGLFWLSVDWYFRSPTYFRSFAAGMISFCMLMTKQTTILIFIPILVYIVVYFDYRELFKWKGVPALALTVAGGICIAVHALLVGSAALDHMQGMGSGFLTRFVNAGLPDSVNAVWNTYGVVPLLGALAGTACCLKTGGYTRALLVMWSWIFGGFLVLSLIGSLEVNLSRWSVLYAPPLFVLGACILVPFSKTRLRTYAGAFVLVSVFVVTAYVPATARHPALDAQTAARQPELKGFEEIAEYVQRLNTGRPVLFCCKHDGNFTFFMRQGDPDRNSVILRADKILVSVVVGPARGIVEHASSDTEILAILDRYGVDLLVLEEGTLAEVPQFERLRALAETDHFSRLKRFTIQSPGTRFDDLRVNLYKMRNPKPIEDGVITIPFPQLGREIRLRLPSQ